MGSEKPWYVPGKWFVSNYNWAEGVRQQMPNLPKKVEIRDVTLREADDQMGLYLTIKDKVKLALKSSAEPLAAPSGDVQGREEGFR
jgi:hypothetical protein